MSGGEIATLIAAVLGGGAVTAFVNGLFTKRKARADAESVQVQNALALVEPYRNQVADMKAEMMGRLAEMREKIDELKERNTELRTELRSTRETLGALSRRERENIEWRAEMTNYVATIREIAHNAGAVIPPPPEPPKPRREYTRAGDLHVSHLDKEEDR